VEGAGDECLIRDPTPLRLDQRLGRDRHIALNSSKGCAQALQYISDLQAVAPNSLFMIVSRERQNGHSTRRCSGTNSGGPRPYAESFSLASSAIQSVVHAGVNTVSTFTCAHPFSCNAAVMSCLMTSIAGQPEYVGVIETVTSP